MQALPMEKERPKNFEGDEQEDVVVPGFRFHPTDEELIGFYLQRKVDGKPLSIEIIRQIDIYKYDPWDLPKASTVGGEKDWYFFCLRGRKYRNSIRPNRVTGSGFWKATGIDRPIYSSSGSVTSCIGLKKSLVYYRGSGGKGTKTDWTMHEFRLPSNRDENDTSTPPSMQEAEVWTICRIFKRNITYKKYQHDINLKQSFIRKNQAQQSSSQQTNNSSESDARDVCSFLSSTTPTCTNQNNTSPLQWNQMQMTPSHSQVSSSPRIAGFQNSDMMNELLKDGNWDELGRIMEYMNDSSAFYDPRLYLN